MEDPTAGGYLCGAKRKPGQLQQLRDDGHEDPWPYCRARAGRGTEHPGYARCKDHAGNSPSGRAAARLKMAELLQPAVVVLAQVITDTKAPKHARIRAAENVFDRCGMPRRTAVDVEAAREHLVDRIAALVEDDEADN